MLSYHSKGELKVVERVVVYLSAHSKLDFSIVTYYEMRYGLLRVGVTHKLADFETVADIGHIWRLDW